ncbi:MAG: hypothetical protein B0D96_01145 [Candidatus Sedimenticola endophacoides]|uniref:Branched-chain amino acid ABC transporter permease n=2 Tax=Candidatus Sedimenticola endophacoides TaxID=2548426 RepID=A0A6N4E7D3_9GAMM|nr:MAG: hypothetical protein B0D96_01145 [Candidatus Sedimenticola endophacoides]OQX41932.1 MAG: hypothetical protein B0D89_02550 [Candidatus Sedimenticola endophacoides]OQX42394.1 MAG: hypothetical protein B0D88_06700 [Candidatus Sedimenticola endophacoides]PUD98169.1 MAG: branched-chain amino acid ABC transporter permease [Candidatus Sedimenticola endophacoides]PUE00789.1 MAG: branched-chain amino acid ABC transporter permease [Candidatus Sedimenticola endophacoides]
MRRLTGFYLLAAFAAALPFVFPDNYFVTVVGTTAALHVILAVSLNLLIGYAGLISLGHAAFFGIGAYSSAILTAHHQINPWLAMLAGVLLSAVIAYAMARPVLRLKGHYLAMATLGFGIIVNIILVQTGNLTGGPDGMSVDELSLFGVAIDSDLGWYTVLAAAALLVVWLSLNIVDSRSGRALRALHGSEVGAEMMGIDTTATKTGVFVLSALIAAFAGSLFAHQHKSVATS